MNELMIAETAIHQDAEGRYCLNDLHRASGGENKQRPSLWLHNKQTGELIDEVSKAGIPAIESKQQLGTFVCKELVYSYAMWISPAFHLKVIRAYDAIATGKMQIKPHDLNDPALLRNVLLGYTERVIALEEKVSEQEPKVKALDRIATADGSMPITNAAKDLQIRPKDLFAFLGGNRWIYRRAGSSVWVAYQDKIQQGLLEHKVTTISTSDGLEKIIEQVRVTPKGLAKLSSMLSVEAA